MPGAALRKLIRILLLCLPAGPALADATVDRMYVLECGQTRTPDVSANWSPGVDVGQARDFSDNCYLIRHGDRWLLWDTGLSDEIAAKPEGVKASNGLLTSWVRRPLQGQLAALGVQPSDVTDLAISHFHSDHAGNANLFAAAHVYLQQREYDAAFGANPSAFGFVPALYEKLRGSTTTLLDGDYDIFGDGSAVILSTPGHTPGHQSLLVRLPQRGAVVLSGDMVHFRANWDARRVPARNFDKDASVSSMERIARLLHEQKAELWINHDRSESDNIAHAPAAVR